MKWLKMLVPFLVLAFFLTACAGGPMSAEMNKKAVKLEKMGATANLSVTFKDKNDAKTEAKGPVSWTSSDAKVATVAAGVVTAVGTGTATISAMAGELTDSATVTVQIPAQLKLGPDTIKMALGDKKKLSAKIIDTAGAEIVGKKIAFKSASPEVAKVSGEGVVNAAGEGVTFVTASWGTLAAKSKIVVKKEKDDKPVKAVGIKKKDTKKGKKGKGKKK